jgi:hypothetical protein
MNSISIAKDYTDTPGGRYIKDGPFSGEDFRNKILAPTFKKSADIVTVDLDGCYGFTSSFLEEAFGGLVREFDLESVKKRVRVACTDEPGLIEEVQEYIENALSKEK